MFIGEAFHALQFDNKHIFDQDVGIVCSYVLALIGDAKRRPPRSPDTTKLKFPKQGTLVQLFEESGAYERVWASAFIGG